MQTVWLDIQLRYPFHQDILELQFDRVVGTVHFAATYCGRVSYPTQYIEKYHTIYVFKLQNNTVVNYKDSQILFIL